MRISDWSSDVCSSDLNGIVDDFLRLNVEFIIAGDPLTVELVDHKRNADFGTVEALEAPTAPKFGGDGVAVENEVLNTRKAIGHRGRQNLTIVDVVGERHSFRSLSKGQIGKHTSELKSLMRSSYAVFCL